MAKSWINAINNFFDNETNLSKILSKQVQNRRIFLHWPTSRFCSTIQLLRTCLLISKLIFLQFNRMRKRWDWINSKNIQITSLSFSWKRVRTYFVNILCYLKKVGQKYDITLLTSVSLKPAKIVRMFSKTVFKRALLATLLNFIGFYHNWMPDATWCLNHNS